MGHSGIQNTLALASLNGMYTVCGQMFSGAALFTFLHSVNTYKLKIDVEVCISVVIVLGPPYVFVRRWVLIYRMTREVTRAKF